MARTLVVVAHRDDETIGAGGLIASFTERGDEIFAVSMTDGTSARSDFKDPVEIQTRLEASQAAASVLGFEWIPGGDFPDNQMDSVPLLSVIRCVELAKAEVEPEMIITHFPFDLNIDHAITARAVFTAFRPEPGEKCREILSMEVASSTDYGLAVGGTPFTPDTYIDVGATFEGKLQALNAYQREIRPYPHSRSLKGIRAQAERRGAEVGLNLAEAFRTHRRILSGR